MLVFNLTKLATTMYKSNSGLGYNSNRYFILIKYITIRKVVCFNPLLLLYEKVVLHYDQPKTNDKIL